MKCPAPESARVGREEICDPIEHLARGLVGEGEEKDVAWIDAVLEQVGDPICQGARLAGAGSGDDQQRTRRRGHRGVLLLI